jgi:hypothetical protein
MEIERQAFLTSASGESVKVEFSIILVTLYIQTKASAIR